MTDEIRLETLGDLLDHGYTFDLWCSRCNQGGSTTAERFIDRLGRGHSSDVSRFIRCRACRGKDLEIKMMPPTTSAT